MRKDSCSRTPYMGTLTPSGGVSDDVLSPLNAVRAEEEKS